MEIINYIDAEKIHPAKAAAGFSYSHLEMLLRSQHPSPRAKRAVNSPVRFPVQKHAASLRALLNAAHTSALLKDIVRTVYAWRFIFAAAAAAGILYAGCMSLFHYSRGFFTPVNLTGSYSTGTFSSSRGQPLSGVQTAGLQSAASLSGTGSALSSTESAANSTTGSANSTTGADYEIQALDDAMKSFACVDTLYEYDDSGNVTAVRVPVSAKMKEISDAKQSHELPRIVSFSNYTVKPGDTISSIAKKSGLSNISTLIAVNSIQNVRMLRSGQKLTIPSMDGMIHTAVQGDSLSSIAKKYGTSVDALLDTNDLSSSVIIPGQKIFIAGAKLDSDSLKKAMGELFKNPLKTAYKLTSPYGYRADPFTGVRTFHTGIDMAAAQGTPVYPAMSGKVVASAFNNVYGNYVIISHGNGYQSLYAHLLKILVRPGQTVDQSMRVGLLGSTGYSTGPHLHFTVYKNGALINPASVIK